MKRITVGTAVTVLTPWLIGAQVFEVVSIKRSNPDSRTITRSDPSQVRLTSVTVKLLIQAAYDVRDFQISGGPGWTMSDRYDINAKLPDDEPMPSPTKAIDEEHKTAQQRRQAMLQALLSDRFQLKIHKEPRELPVYVLTVAKGGPKLKENNGTQDPNVRRGILFQMGVLSALSGFQVEMSSFIKALSGIMGRTVLDHTGLRGLYDLQVKWARDETSSLSPQGDSTSAFGLGPGLPPPDPNAPTIFIALQEQLGLKLESSKGPAEVIIIDRVEKPSEN
jgi:bla regulator protein blaR1